MQNNLFCLQNTTTTVKPIHCSYQELFRPSCLAGRLATLAPLTLSNRDLVFYDTTLLAGILAGGRGEESLQGERRTLCQSNLARKELSLMLGGPNLLLELITILRI